VIPTLCILFVLAASGTALGLAISAGARTENAAVTAIPIALVPQILLADAITPLSGPSKALAQLFITSYWGVRGLNSVLPEKVANLALLERASVIGALGVVILHILVFSAVATLLLMKQDRRSQRLSHALGIWLRSAGKRWQ
jgi:hypothetical protein